MKLTANEIPFSGMFGGGLGLVDEAGAAKFMIVFMGTTDGISNDQRHELARQIGEMINARGLDVPETETRR
jgi:hypothetical protein